ncbi:hypothetical protein [Micromonospora sp. NPDC005161]
MGQLSDYGVPTVLRGAVEVQGDVYALYLTEHRDVESWSLGFMESGDPNEQSTEHGMDTYCLGAGSDSHSYWYGGIVECEISASKQPTLPKMPPSDTSELRLVLTQQTAGQLGLPTQVSFTLCLTLRQLLMVKRGLTRVLTSGRPGDTPRLL